MKLEIVKLSKSFGNKQILSGLSMELEGGRITGLFGPSGCGKSTVARILCGLEEPDGGDVLLDGQKLLSKGYYDRKAGLGIQIVWQQPHASLDPVQRVGTGLKELASYHGLASGGKELESLTDGVLASVGLSGDIKKHFPRQLSGGEAQRIALARALMLSPRLLIMDEATSMLDVSMQANISALVKEKIEKTGMGVLFISHDRDLLDHLADDIYVFKNGGVESSSIGHK
ncbi:MAG: ABC transporter ATP-binding protein [Firmicutes bacterium]|nr:ABC transporter ATP-binding protein [Bacillota bacterium]